MKNILWIYTILFLTNCTNPEKAQDYKNIDEFFNAPVSRFFGFTEGYQPKNTSTIYRVAAPESDNSDDLTQAWFDISNNNITCSVNSNGLVEYPTVLGPLKGRDSKFSGGDYITGSQWTLILQDGIQRILLSDISNPELDIVENIFYKWIYRWNDLNIQLLAFAPESEEDPLIPEPRALIMIVRLENTGNGRLKGKISVPDHIKDAFTIDTLLKIAPVYGPAVLPVADNHKGSRANYHPRWSEVAPTIAGYEAVALLGSTRWDPSFPNVSFSLEPKEKINMEFAFLVGGNAGELIHTRDFVRSKQTISWLNSTARLHKKATGELNLPEDPMLAELFERYYECGHNCYILDGNGILSEPKGGAWSMMGLLNPGYSLGTILNANRVGDMVPYHMASIKKNVSFSLYGSTEDLIIASDYYQFTGDTTLVTNPVFRKYSTQLINEILATQYPGATLFPSRKIWDGPSRGDYHTGSNILVWRVLDVFSRIAGEVWLDQSLAEYWSKKAQSCKKDILSKCVIIGPYGDQFGEGTWKTGETDLATSSHDGEEVVLVQSGFYRFLEQDNPLITNHCRASMTPFNYLYHKRLNAIMWSWETIDIKNDALYPTTFPGWLVLIAGATQKSDLLSGLERWKSMTDVDGSPWWWPYDAGQTDASVVNRRKCSGPWGFVDVAKVSYASSVFNTLLINNILGLSADIPGKTVSFKPFPSWSSFGWMNGRIGNAFFDIDYSDKGSAVKASITNRNRESYTATIGITLPENLIPSDGIPTGNRYGRPYYEITRKLFPGQTDSLVIRYNSSVP